MTTIELKQYIFDNNKVEFILEQIGCTHISYHPNKEFWSAANYNGDNPSAVNVKNNPYLNVRNWTRQKDFDDNADIITLVQYNKQISFIQAVKYLHQILDLQYSYSKRKDNLPVKQKDLVQYFKRFSCGETSDVRDLVVLDEDILTEYVPILHIDWFREGIMPWTAEKFGLLYSYRRKRIIIPMRYYLTGELLGFNARTTIPNYEELGIKKYFITPTYPKLNNLYGLYEHKESIQKAGYVVIYESEKSVLKRDSLGDCTGVALSGHTMSDEQKRILIGLDVDIVISLDNDIDQEEIRYLCEKIYGRRNVYYTYDKWNLLGKKESIADKSCKIFDFFMKHKVKYDYKEHKEYLKSIEK